MSMSIPRSASLLLALVLAPALASAAPVEVRAEDVHAALVGNPRAYVIDARSPQEYEQAHIPGAINIPADRVKAEAFRLPHDRAMPLIFYCRGFG